LGAASISLHIQYPDLPDIDIWIFGYLDIWIISGYLDIGDFILLRTESKNLFEIWKSLFQILKSHPGNLEILKSRNLEILKCGNSNWKSVGWKP
jgi:hypothetical protein